MSDPRKEFIDETIELVRAIWKQFPQQRLGQLLVNAARGDANWPDIFNISDTEIRKRLTTLVSRWDYTYEEPTK